MRKIVGIGETVLDINFRKSHLRNLRDTFENIQENCRLSDVVRGSSEDFVFFIVCYGYLIVAVFVLKSSFVKTFDFSPQVQMKYIQSPAKAS